MLYANDNDDNGDDNIVFIVSIYKGKVKSIHLRYENIYDDNDNVIDNYFRYNDNEDENDDNGEH